MKPDVRISARGLRREITRLAAIEKGSRGERSQIDSYWLSAAIQALRWALDGSNCAPSRCVKKAAIRG